jgi:S-adenosylmethionine hydrolase
LISWTFHGRDIIAPVAAFLAAGGDLAKVGSPVVSPILLEQFKSAQFEPDGSWLCPVDSIDHFGNVQLSCQSLLEQLKLGCSLELELVDGGRLRVPVVATYGDALPGSTVLLRDSQGRLELAVVHGSAAQKYSLNNCRNVKFWLQ